MTYVEATFGLRFVIPSRVTRDRVDTLIPWMLMRSILSRLAKEKGHRVRVMGVSRAVEHIFSETAMHPKAQASNRMAKANRASHAPRVSSHSQAKARVKKTRENPKENPKEPRCQRLTQGQTSKAVLSGLENSKSEASSDIQEAAQTCTTDISWKVGIVTNGPMAGVMMNGMMIGVLLDGTKDGNKRKTLPQSHFHLEVWMSVPPAVRSGLIG